MKREKFMTRVQRGIVARKRRKKILSITSGFRGAASVLFRTANQRYMKALRSAYQNRRQKKRDFRRLWISRLNAAVRNNGLSYNEFIHALKTCNIALDRQILSQLSLCDANSFAVLYEKLLPNLILFLKTKKKSVE
uniref:Large ribosomal subunit protein bL20c n=1 Tax=Floydiella terrestris TaxID=51328 RepID=E2DSP4_FLOTE|nr:ribosomal protein L20 [Floydiella terrestris]ACZ58497.1 ribosomal protein L20 [Floydiella terrestris]